MNLTPKAASGVKSELRMGQSESSREDRKAPKYYGLFNQGATCYLNSVLQVLFMTKDFRKAVERSTDENPDSIDHDLKSLFSDLQKKSADTFKITRKLGINRVYKQCDAAEYIEKILRLTNKDASQIFHGLMSHKTKCCKCDTQTDRDEAFLHLPLALVDSCSDVYSVVDGIRNFFRDSVFSGEDQMYCETCDDKADATTQYVMKHHPDVLILQLKRFEFSYHHMSYVKNSRTVDVPFTIQIPERQTYKLYAVVNHSGDLRGGHYTATIKDEGEDRWYNFDDSRVSLCFYQPFQVDHTERSQTSQLLFYRKTEETVNQGNVSTDHSQCEEAEKTRQRGQGEADSETGDDTPVAVSVIKNKAKGNDLDRDVSRGVGLSEEPGNEGNVIQSETHNNQGDNEDRNHDYREDANSTMQKIGKGTQREDNEEDIREKAEADDQKQNTRLASVEIKPGESIKNQTAESDTNREIRLNANSKPEVSDKPKICDLPNQQEEINDAQSRGRDTEKMSGDKDSEQLPMDNFDKDAEHLSEGGLYKQNRQKDQGSNLKIEQHFDLGLVGKQGDEERKNNVEDNTERQTGANEYQSESVKPLTKHDSEYKKKSSSRLDKNPEQRKKDKKSDVQKSNEPERRDPGKKHGGNENPDNRSLHDARLTKSKNSSAEFLSIKEEDNVETHIYEIKIGTKGFCNDGTVGNYTRSKPGNQEYKRHISQPLGRNDEDKKGEKSDSKRDGGHDQRRGSARKDSESGKCKYSGRLDEGIGQKNVKNQAKEKEEKRDPEQFHNREDLGQEGTVRENQKRGSGQRSVHNKGQDNQPDVESVQRSDKDTGPVETNKRKRF